MIENHDSRNEFVIPQRRAGRHFREATSNRNIDQISFETTSGSQLVELPIKVNVNKAVPGVFRLPLQGIVTAISAVARIFRIKIVLGLIKDH